MPPILLFSTSLLEARDLEIVAHLGANHLAPKNTFAAAGICVDLRIDYVEIDVRKSKDRVLYVIHDSKLDRTTDGTGLVPERDSSYTDSLDAGSWFGPEHTGEKVPRLEAFPERFRGRI